MTAQDQLDIRNRHRLTVEEYLLLDREGAFGDRNTELFDGEVYYMSPKHRPQSRVLGDFYWSHLWIKAPDFSRERLQPILLRS